MAGKKTPLYDEHLKLGGKIVDYAGWLLPIQYEGLVIEHNAVRERAGIFDVSHMGLIQVEGRDALAFLDYLMTNNINRIKRNQIIYTFMCYPDGGVVDDLLVYKHHKEKFLLVVNAANLEKDLEWIEENKNNYQVEIEDITEEISILALQGPEAESILQGLTETDLSKIKFFHFKEDIKICNISALVSRTGYTGEDGVEIFVQSKKVEKLWEQILDFGKDYGLKPAGLGCRDTLRFQAALPLYGKELSADISPIEADLKFFVKVNKPSNFIGKDALKEQVDGNIKRLLVGFELLDRGIPREGYKLYKADKEIGYVTTGYMSPSLGKSIGNALIDIDEAKIGNEIDIMIRNRAVKAKIIDRNFLKNNK